MKAGEETKKQLQLLRLVACFATYPCWACRLHDLWHADGFHRTAKLL